MSKKEEFLKDLEDLCRKYDTDEKDVDIYVASDGGEYVITIDLPFTMRWQSFILPYRPYDGRR